MLVSKDYKVIGNRILKGPSIELSKVLTTFTKNSRARDQRGNRHVKKKIDTEVETTKKTSLKCQEEETVVVEVEVAAEAVDTTRTKINMDQTRKQSTCSVQTV